MDSNTWLSLNESIRSTVYRALEQGMTTEELLDIVNEAIEEAVT